MRQGKYVFIVRPNGTYKHCRNLRWQRFLLGRCPIGISEYSPLSSTTQGATLAPGLSKVTAIEIDTAAAGSRCLRRFSNFCLRETWLNSDGYYQSSEPKKLSYSEFCAAFLALSPESNGLNAPAKQSDSFAVLAPPLEDGGGMQHQMVADYIQQLLGDEQKSMPVEQYDAFGHADLVEVNQSSSASHNVRVLPRRCA